MIIEKGQQAIDFQVEDISGNTIILSELQEKIILLSFFRYASCPFCNLRIQELIKHYSLFQEKELRILAFFQSPKESILEYVTSKQEVPFDIIADPTRKIYDLYGVYSSRWGYIKGLLHVRTFNKARRKGFRLGRMEGKTALIPADFLINNLKIIEAFYGKDISDHMPLEMIIEHL